MPVSRFPGPSGARKATLRWRPRNYKTRFWFQEGRGKIFSRVSAECGAGEAIEELQCERFTKLRAAGAQLFRMSDRELADIGLCRGDITFAIREVAHGVAPEIDGEMRSVSAANQNMRRAA